jgi:hypothetical protein
MGGMLAHCAGHGAVLAMPRQLAIEGGPHKIRANIPLRRIGSPEDIAYCAASRGAA